MMKYTDWATFHIARCTYCEGRPDMKLVWILVKGKIPVRFWDGDKWVRDCQKAVTFPTADAARERAYNIQSECQDTIVAEGIYRRANAASDFSRRQPR